MGHVGLSLYFQLCNQNRQDEFNAANFLEVIQQHRVTSRNTAAAFLGEMLQYGILTQRPHRRDKRIRVLVPTASTIEAFRLWVEIHLATLDRLDDGGRCAHSRAHNRLSHFQPMVAEGLLQSALIREPAAPIAHFMSINSGFLIMERLILSIDRHDERRARYHTRLRSIQEVVTGFRLSRSHSARKISEGEASGILGWEGAKGRSTIWVSAEFVDGFIAQQMEKLAIIDRAFDQQWRIAEQN